MLNQIEARVDMEEELAALFLSIFIKPFVSGFANKLGQRVAEPTSTQHSPKQHTSTRIIKHVFVHNGLIYMKDVDQNPGSVKMTVDAINWSYTRMPPAATYVGYVFITESFIEYFTNGHQTWHLPLGTG